MTKPTVFVGSSTEGLEFARATRGLLHDDAEVTLWNEDFFQMGTTFIEGLVDSLPGFDFAVLVLTPDDLVTSRGVGSLSPRDNVIFELGLFMGQLGRARTFLMYTSDAKIKIPSDLSGVTMATYHWPRADQNYSAAVGAACDKIRRVINELGPSERKLARQLGVIRERQAEQQLQLDALAFVVRTYIPWPEYGHLWSLSQDRQFPFKATQAFKTELRRLRALGVIKGKSGVTVERLPPTGDLRDFFHITDAGIRYIQYRERFEELAAEA